MKRKLLLMLNLCIVFAARAQQTIINDPNAELRKITSFNAIVVTDGIDLFLSQGTEEALAVSASTTSVRDGINILVDDSVLKISYLNDGRLWVSGNKRMRAYISFKTIEKLKASNSSDVFISGLLHAENLKIELSGASDLKGKIEARKLDLEQSGASDVVLSGKVEELLVNASGASDFQGYGLTAEVCTVNASGASEVRVTVNKELNANANGASAVKYHGKPVVHDSRKPVAERAEQ